MKTASALLNVATFVIDQEDQNRAPQHRGRGRRGGGGVSWKTNTEGGVFENGVSRVHLMRKLSFSRPSVAASAPFRAVV